MAYFTPAGLRIPPLPFPEEPYFVEFRKQKDWLFPEIEPSIVKQISLGINYPISKDNLRLPTLTDEITPSFIGQAQASLLGDYIIASDLDRAFLLKWEEEVKNYTLLFEASGDFSTANTKRVTISRDGSRFALIRPIRIYDTATQTLLLEAGLFYAAGVALDSNGSHLAIQSSFWLELHYFDGSSLTKLWRVEPTVGIFSNPLISGDGSTVAVVDWSVWEGYGRLIRFRDGIPVSSIYIGEGLLAPQPNVRIEGTPDLDCICLASPNARFYIIGNKIVWKEIFPLVERDWNFSIGISDDGKAVFGYKGYLALIDKGNLIWEQGFPSLFLCSISPNGKRILLSCLDMSQLILSDEREVLDAFTPLSVSLPWDSYSFGTITNQGFFFGLGRVSWLNRGKFELSGWARFSIMFPAPISLPFLTTFSSIPDGTSIKLVIKVTTPDESLTDVSSLEGGTDIFYLPFLLEDVELEIQMKSNSTDKTPSFLVLRLREYPIIYTKEEWEFSDISLGEFHWEKEGYDFADVLTLSTSEGRITTKFRVHELAWGSIQLKFFKIFSSIVKGSVIVKYLAYKDLNWTDILTVELQDSVTYGDLKEYFPQIKFVFDFSKAKAGEAKIFYFELKPRIEYFLFNKLFIPPPWRYPLVGRTLIEPTLITTLDYGDKIVELPIPFKENLTGSQLQNLGGKTTEITIQKTLYPNEKSKEEQLKEWEDKLKKGEEFMYDDVMVRPEMIIVSDIEGEPLSYEMEIKGKSRRVKGR